MTEESAAGDDWTLSRLHELPWSTVKGAAVRVRQERDTRVAVPAAGDVRDGAVSVEEREGELVGRAEGKGLYYDSSQGEHFPDTIGPCIYLDTPEETTLEVRTDTVGNELLAVNLEGDR